MAMYRLLKFQAFQPEEITCMTAAYEDALRVLQLADYKALARTRAGKPLPSFHHLRESINPSGEANRLLARVAGRGIYSRQKA
jgi:hypothetical protein